MGACSILCRVEQCNLSGAFAPRLLCVPCASAVNLSRRLTNARTLPKSRTFPRRTDPAPRKSGDDMYAIIEGGGRRYKVTGGDRILIDREVGEDEKTITLGRVLLVGGDGEPKIGAPLVAGAT